MYPSFGNIRNNIGKSIKYNLLTDILTDFLTDGSKSSIVKNSHIMYDIINVPIITRAQNEVEKSILTLTVMSFNLHIENIQLHLWI